MIIGWCAIFLFRCVCVCGWCVVFYLIYIVKSLYIYVVAMCAALYGAVLYGVYIYLKMANFHVREARGHQAIEVLYLFMDRDLTNTDASKFFPPSQSLSIRITSREERCESKNENKWEKSR